MKASKIIMFLLPNDMHLDKLNSDLKAVWTVKQSLHHYKSFFLKKNSNLNEILIDQSVAFSCAKLKSETVTEVKSPFSR